MTATLLSNLSVCSRLALGLTLAFAGCASPPAQRLGALVRVESDPGVPLAGAQVLFEGRELGASNDRGELSLELSGPPGEQIVLEVRCPQGHRALTSTLRVVLRTMGDPTRPPEYRAECRPELRTLVIAVRASGGAFVPVRHLGKEIARTDAHGTAHVRLRLQADEPVALELDTSAPEHHALRPKTPGLALTMPDRDDVVLFDQPFAREAQKRRPLRVPAPLLPVRL